MPSRNCLISLIVVCLALVTLNCRTRAQTPNVSNAVDQRTAGSDESMQGDRKSDHWAFRPVVVRPLPDVHNRMWPQTAIDRFILAELEANDLRPAPSADPRTLIRRATFDLIGLPPTPEEVREFLADDSADAFAKVVERLLSSPHYGERWGRHWLDVARYADSNGMDENLAYGNAFRYRDYVVDALNADRPFDQFIREQIAGDLLAKSEDESINHRRAIATGFLALGPKMLAEDDPVKMQMDIVDEQIDTVGRALLGISLGCARCHDHKFDPISTEDYYALAGIFKSTKTMENFKVVARWFERPLETEVFLDRKTQHTAQLAAKQKELEEFLRRAKDELIRDAHNRLADYLLDATRWNRQRAKTAKLDSLMAAGQETPPTDAIVIEAEDFARGNVRRDFDTYGRGIGVLVNQGELPNFTEYEITVPEPGAYQLEVRYAAAVSRPVRLSIDGRLVKDAAAANITGSWTPESQAWAAAGVYVIEETTAKVRLERDEPFPHIDKMALIPRAELGDGAAAQSFDQLAAERDLNVAMLERFAAYLDATREQADSIFAAWHRLDTVTHVAAAENDDPDQHSTAEVSINDEPSSRAALLPLAFADVLTEAQQRLAERYQELFQSSSDVPAATRPLKNGTGSEPRRTNPDENGNSEVPVPFLQHATKSLSLKTRDAIAKVYSDATGPFTFPDELDAFVSAESATTLKQLRDELKEIKSRAPQAAHAPGVTEGDVADVPIHVRGSHWNLGREVARRVPSALARGDRLPFPKDRSGRLELAEWLTAEDHPLVARVIVNRIWRWHLGAGIVRTPDNFGIMGEPPTHGELLDWLSANLIESGWSIKDLHRQIMLSSTYRMSTAQDEIAIDRDPENRLWWRTNRRRLEAEALRDAMLSVSGTLDPTIGGTLLATKNRAYVTSTASVDPTQYDAPRRSIYLPVVRSALYDVFQTFDFPDPSALAGDRATTTVAPQALALLNSRLVDAQSLAFAERLLSHTELSDSERIGLAYEIAFAREPDDEELADAMSFVRAYEEQLAARETDAGERRHRAWQSLCRVLFASSEFVYVE